jgi:hypothetical protein
MKKLISMIALVAMVAMSSVAFAQDTFTVTTTVAAATSVFTATDCTTTNPPTAAFTNLQYADEKIETCDLIITANSAFSLTSGDQDADVGASTSGAPGGIPCTGTCDTTALTGDSIAAASADVTGGIDGGEAGYFVTGTPTPDVCNANTAVCDAVVTQDALFTNELTALDTETFTYSFDVAIDNDGVKQAAGTYSDGWQVTFS